jgi:hypothetical protein
MILLAHLLFGAAIGLIIKNPFLAIILAFLSHYFLDLMPHIEYPIDNIRQKQWHKSGPDFLRVILDFCLGILFISIFSGHLTFSKQLFVYACAFFSILPDGFTVLNYLFKNRLLEVHNNFHRKIIHFVNYFEYKKISVFWRISTQIVVILISIILL